MTPTATLAEVESDLLAYADSGWRGTAKTYALGFWREAKDDDLGGLAAELAFKLTLALFPLLLFLAALSSYLVRWSGADNPADRIVSALGDSLPSDASSVIEKSINDVLSGSNPGLVSISAIATIWPASGVAKALIKAVNRVNDVEDTRPAWKRIALTAGLTVGGGLALLVAISALVLSDVFARDLSGAVGLGPAWQWGTRFARVPVVALFVILAAQLLFWVAPAQRGPFRFWSPGAVLFGLGWTVFSALFSLYVTTFAGYSATYGSLAGVAIFLVWLNTSSWLLLAGAEWNWVLANRPIVTTTTALAADAEQSVPPSLAPLNEPVIGPTPEIKDLPPRAAPEENRKNVVGKRLSPSDHGFGQLWRKEISVVLQGQSSPEVVMSELRRHLGALWPSTGRLFVPLRSPHPGDILGVDVHLGPVQLATGIAVTEVTPTTMVVVPPEGHIFAGSNRFVATEAGDGTRVAVQITVRASDPIFELALMLGGHRREEMFWAELLRNLAAHFGEPRASVHLHRELVNRRRKWRNAANVRHNAVLRSWLRKLRTLGGMSDAKV